MSEHKYLEREIRVLEGYKELFIKLVESHIRKNGQFKVAPGLYILTKDRITSEIPRWTKKDFSQYKFWFQPTDNHDYYDHIKGFDDIEEAVDHVMNELFRGIACSNGS